MVHVLNSRVIAFHETFYCIGFDLDKVKKGIEDRTEMSTIDTSKPWNKGAVVCMKKYYSDVNSSKEEMIAENDLIMQLPVITL